MGADGLRSCCRPEDTNEAVDERVPPATRALPGVGADARLLPEADVDFGGWRASPAKLPHQTRVRTEYVDICQAPGGSIALFCGSWMHSSGGVVSVSLINGMLDISNPHGLKQLVRAGKVVQSDGSYLYMGFTGVLKGNRITWSDGSAWTRCSKQDSAALPEDDQPVICLRPLQPTDLVTWATFGAPSLGKSAGKWYYELRFGAGDLTRPQVGWATEHFLRGEASNEGVGDDEYSWAADGLRGHKRHGTLQDVTWPVTWCKGGVIGCAIDVEAGSMEFSYNGSWLQSAAFEFDAQGRSFAPAVSSDGMFRFAFGASAFRYTPPDDSYRGLLSDSTRQFGRPTRFE